MAVFTTTATHSEMLNALECANEASREKRFCDRFDRAYWVCEEVAKAVDGRCEFVGDDKDKKAFAAGSRLTQR